MERTHEVMLDLVEKYDRFRASVLTNGWYDTNKSSSDMPKTTVKRLLADSKIDWEECLLECDTPVIYFMRYAGKDSNGNQITEEYNITLTKKDYCCN